MFRRRYVAAVKRALPLIAILSLLALGASIVRAVAQLQLLAAVGGGFTQRTLAVLEVGNWLSWTVWAALLVAAIARVGARPRLGTSGFAMLVLLALAPMIAVPVLASPWHFLATDSLGVAASAAHITRHNLPTNLLLGVAMVAVAHGRSALDRTRALEQTAAQLRVQLAESQLATLRAQLDPHFLFNALNSVVVLARRGEVALLEALISHLSALLRHSLESARSQVVPLRVEVEALRHYLDIEQVRHGERLVVRWEIDSALLERLVPSFVLQPLVENAVHHGLTGPARPLTIEIGAMAREEQLLLVVRDDGEGLTMADREHRAEGIGLGHTRARLAGLYGPASSLSLAPGADGRGACVTIALPLAASIEGSG